MRGWETVLALLVASHPEFSGLIFVMPAYAGIQERQEAGLRVGSPGFPLSRE